MTSIAAASLGCSGHVRCNVPVSVLSYDASVDIAGGIRRSPQLFDPGVLGSIVPLIPAHVRGKAQFSK